MKRLQRQYGLTLVEILIAVALMMILASIVLMVTERSYSYSEQKATEGEIAILDSALEEYHDFWGAFPDPNVLITIPANVTRHSASLYSQLIIVPESKKVLEQFADSHIKTVEVSGSSYLEFVDSWGIELDYEYITGMNFPKITSAGPDKNFVTADDNITNKK
jgi:type II secretory pathway pseudopilin PulG